MLNLPRELSAINKIGASDMRIAGDAGEPRQDWETH